ncbi:hypothetical protein DV736_g5876, partial [Chaetothyriales sp. CBS 134916]
MPPKKRKTVSSEEQKETDQSTSATGRLRRAAKENAPQYNFTRKRSSSRPATNDKRPKKARATSSPTTTKDNGAPRRGRSPKLSIDHEEPESTPKSVPKNKPVKVKGTIEIEMDEEVISKTGGTDQAISTVNGDTKIDESIQYWLMKAEPESRIEKGVDVKFSIDDLKAKTEPEGWDGVRNPVARNNMRAMRAGDLAFFYHSNCSNPGIVGVMRIVKEHEVDESAFDPAHPYYDPKSTREKPKWELVKVEFVKKFDAMMNLKELKSFAGPGGALENMQTLKQSRLSVSSVQPKEWRFILQQVGERYDLGH